MSNAGWSSSNPAVKRILKEAREIESAGANPDFDAKPMESNLFEWHFTIRGPPGTAFEGGRFHGRITLPPEYPFKPPSIELLNASGRFSVGKKICLSVSAHHPEHWQPAWGIRTIITALIAFFPTKADGALAGLDYSDSERRTLAAASRQWRCPRCDLHMDEALPEESACPPCTSSLPPVPAELQFAHEATPSSPAPRPTPPSEAAAATAATTPSALATTPAAPVAPSPPAAPAAAASGAADGEKCCTECSSASATATSAAATSAAAPTGPGASAASASASAVAASASTSTPATPPPPPAVFRYDPPLEEEQPRQPAPAQFDFLGVVAALLVGAIAMLVTRKLGGDD